MAALLLHPDDKEQDDVRVTKAHKIAFRSRDVLHSILRSGMDWSFRGVPSCIQNYGRCLDTHWPSKLSQNVGGPKTSVAAFSFKFLSGLPRS